MKNIVILGSTGSIGAQTLEVVRKHRSRLKIVGIAAYSRLETVKAQIREFRPRVVAIGDKNLAPILESWCRQQRCATTVLTGHDGLIAAACLEDADMVLSSVVGAVGLEPLLAAIKRKKDIALANKEALVVAGDCIMREVRKNGVNLFPVDSEHSAIFQCLKAEDPRKVRRIILTASGGPFYRTKKRMSDITVADALAHPTWAMGPKITVDSATLMNKGLEAIEAHHLFAVPLENINIVIHPQSIVHSMVEYVDGSVLAQLSKPDMRLPIQHALLYPERCCSTVEPLDLVQAGRLEFDKPDFSRFPCLSLALEAGSRGGTMPAVMNAANEVAVAAFLNKKLSFTAIARIVESVMARHRVKKTPALTEILAADTWAREQAHVQVGKKLNA